MIQYVDSNNIKLIQSPITEFVIGCAADVLSVGKSMIVEFPSSFSEVSLIIANDFTHLNKKTTIIFTNPSTINELNTDYYHLYDNNVPLRLRVPLGIKTDSGIKLKPVFLKNAKKNIKCSLKEDYNRALVAGNKSIILLASNDEKLEKIEGEVLNDDIKSPSLAIFNNISYDNYSKINKIIQWCKKNNIQFLILTSFIAPKYYKSIPDDIVVLPMHKGLLNSPQFDTSLLKEPFESPVYQNHSELFNKFNIDRYYNYIKKIDLQYCEIENGSSLIVAQKQMVGAVRNLLSVSKDLHHEIMQLLNISNESIDSFTPIRSITKYSIVANCRINGEGFCEIISKLALAGDKSINYLCNLLTSSFKTLWNILDQCRSPIYDRGFKKDNKFTKLLHIINENLGQYDKIYIVPINKSELNLINKLLITVIPKYLDKLVICSPSNLSDKDYSKCMMVLPGRPALNELYITNYSFSKIIILTYHGDNTQFTKDVLDLFNDVENYCSEYFVSSLFKLESCSDKIKTHIDKVSFLKTISHSASASNSEPSTESQKFEEIQKKLNKQSPTFKGYLSSLAVIDSYKKSYEDEVSKEYVRNLQKLSEYYILSLQNIDSGEESVIYSSIRTEHPFFIDGELQEKPISMDSVGDILINVPGKHEDLLNMLLDLYGYRDKIDYEVVEVWEECMNSFDRDVPHAVLNFYAQYVKYGGKKQKQTVRTWLNRKCLGPDSKEDLIILGNALKNDDLVKNAKYIFDELQRIRNFKRALGRRLCGIIGAVLDNKGECADDPFVITITENVKKYLFRISKVMYVKDGKLTGAQK